jgi:DNA repair exonuclease SbcCD ATPase subunit
MVQLLKLELEGFGKFDKEKTINFGNGINFITGLNETGKSTILEALMASIFKYTRNQIEPFLCWENEDTCRTALTYKIAKGDIFRILSDYKSGKRRLEKIEKNKIKEISSVDKNIEPYLKEHFGFDDKKVFENTAFIRQSQMAILEDASVRNKIKDMIEEVFAGRSEASATKALAKMKRIAKDSSEEIEDLEDEQEELKEKLKSAEDTKETVVKDSGEFEKTVKGLEVKSKELDKLQKSKKLFDEKEGLLKDQKHIGEQIEKVDELLEAVSEEKEEVQTKTSSKTVGIILIVLGGLISLTGIGAIIGIPILIWGIIKVTKKEKKVKTVVSTDVGVKKAKYQREKKELLNKKAVLEDRLENYKLVNFNSNDFDDLEDLKQEVDTLKAKKVELQTSIKTTTSLVESPEDIKEKLDVIEENKLNLEKKIEEHELAAKFLGLAETQVQQKFTPSIEKNSKPLLKEITNQRYSDLKIEEETMDIKVKVPETRNYVDVSFLSQGARDQLYFTLRTVMSDLLGGNINIPLILDDPFHNFDQIRLNKTIDTIKQISKVKQIILISHRPYHQEFKGFCENVVVL